MKTECSIIYKIRWINKHILFGFSPNSHRCEQGRLPNPAAQIYTPLIGFVFHMLTGVVEERIHVVCQKVFLKPNKLIA